MDKIITDSNRAGDGLTGIKPPLICIPIMAKSLDELINQAVEAVKCRPDIIEWRADGLGPACSAEGISRALSGIKGVIGNMPLIFTFRRKEEGGLAHVPEEIRLSLIKGALRSRALDYIDLELCTALGDILNIKALTKQYSTKLILSYHDFENTPEREAMYRKIKAAEGFGADMAKIAVTARSRRDVLTLIELTYQVTNNDVKIPVTVMSMGDFGAFTRIATGFFGTRIIYASGKTPTATGQMPVAALHNMLRFLYGECEG